MIEVLRENLRKLCEEYGLEPPDLLVNSRLRTTAGRFRWFRRGEKPPFIEISGRYMDTFSLKDALGVLRHEFAHYHQWERTGRTSHNREFKDFCAKIGATMPVSMAGKSWAGCATSNFCESPHKYRYTCTGCGVSVKRRRRIPVKMVCRRCETPVSRWEVEALAS